MERIPPPLTTLLETNIDSYEKLEVLRALRFAGGPLTRAYLANTLAFHERALEDAIDELARDGFLVAGEPLRLGGRVADPQFASLMELYEREQASVLSALSRSAVRRIREGAARALVERRGLRDDESE